LKIQYKIVIPFTLLFVIATFITALVSISLMTRNLEERLDLQLIQASKLVSRADFALNPTILTSLKAVTGADIITCRRDGTILATTLSPPTRSKVAPIVLGTDVPASILTHDREFVLREVRIDGAPYKIAYRPLSSPPDTLIAVLADTSEIANTRNTIAKLVLLIAGLIVLTMSLVSQAIAKSVTGPMLRLVEFTKKVAAGERAERAVIASRDEVGVLAGAFNEMVGQLQDSEAKALRSEKLALTGLLAARVAHEIRNPLSAMKMQAQLLRSRIEARGDASELELVVSVLQAIERVEWVVRGMLNLASAQQLHLNKEDIRDVLEEVLEVTSPQLRHRKITPRKSFDDDLPLVALDRDRFKLALLNLIVNASEAMLSGGVLEVSAHRARHRNSVVVEIADDGQGIDPSIRDRLFDPFVTTKREGVGLGLVNTKNVVEAHHGTVKLVPKEGGGTRAIIELPIESAAEVGSTNG
jgi:signal transduction histidine kinase